MPTNNAINSNIPIEIGKGGTGSTTNGFGYSTGGNFGMGYSGTSPYSSCVKEAAGNGYGGGGAQHYNNQGAAAKAGYAGSAGVVFITEFLA